MRHAGKHLDDAAAQHRFPRGGFDPLGSLVEVLKHEVLPVVSGFIDRDTTAHVVEQLAEPGLALPQRLSARRRWVMSRTMAIRQRTPAVSRKRALISTGNATPSRRSPPALTSGASRGPSTIPISRTRPAAMPATSAHTKQACESSLQTNWAATCSSDSRASWAGTTKRKADPWPSRGHGARYPAPSPVTAAWCRAP